MPFRSLISLSSRSRRRDSRSCPPSSGRGQDEVGEDRGESELRLDEMESKRGGDLPKIGRRSGEVMVEILRRFAERHRRRWARLCARAPVWM
eukprot:6202105-Pleurochrysis_carterae.AAC.1